MYYAWVTILPIILSIQIYHCSMSCNSWFKLLSITFIKVWEYILLICLNVNENNTAEQSDYCPYLISGGYRNRLILENPIKSLFQKLYRL